MRRSPLIQPRVTTAEDENGSSNSATQGGSTDDQDDRDGEGIHETTNSRPSLTRGASTRLSLARASRRVSIGAADVAFWFWKCGMRAWHAWDDAAVATKVRALALAFLAFVYGSDNRLADLDVVLGPLFAGLIWMACDRADTSHVTGRILLYSTVGLLCWAALTVNYVADHPCTSCLIQVPEMIHKHLIPKPGNEPLMLHQDPSMANGLLLWKTLITEESPVSQQCAVCLSLFTGTYSWFAGTGILSNKYVSEKLEQYGLDRLGLFEEDNEEMLPTCFDDRVNEIPLKEFEIGHSQGRLRELDEWYTDLKKKSYPKGAPRRFVQALATGVSSELGSELLAETTRDALCHPYSRMSGPSPSDFVLSLRRSRFTGESKDNDGPMNITMGALQAIMRGDAMQQLGPHICFMVRLAGLIPEDSTVLTDMISPGDIAPNVNETTLKGVDGAFLYPGLFVPMTDEDKDKDGESADITEAMLSLFIKLPQKDWVPIFFDTKEEYIAFFRWHIEHKLQDEYYLPKWLAHASVDTKDTKLRKRVEGLVTETGNLVSHQFRFHNERLRLTDPTTDETLSDRAFYGTGMKHIMQVKLPGDDDYEFLHPANPDFYETEEHREFFRNKIMPSEDDFLRMGHVFWGKKVNLEYFRKRVVEIDYTVATHWHHRDLFEDQGAILYLEAKSRKPMGIWVSALEQIVLPTSGRPWEYAKFHYRATELTVMALIHVAEYHLGWANIFSNAIRQTLPPHHGLRVFLKPYTHGTGSVNWNAYQMLIRDRSILDRASGLTRSARGYTWGHIQKHWEMYKPFPQVLQEKRLDGMSGLTKVIPFFSQGLALYNVHKDFVNGMLDILYPTEEAMQADTALLRFWNHINTYGRHLDPCVCRMESDDFYEPNVWPDFETTENRRCEYLLDFHGVPEDDSPSQRRDKWCSRHAVERTRAFHALLQAECAASTDCDSLSYEFVHMRADFGLPTLPTRKTLGDILSTFIFQVTSGHELAADNIPYMVDPQYGGVRLQRKDSHGKLPLKVDIASYISGTVIAALTTIRSKPLLSDWSNLLVDWVENEADRSVLSDADRAERRRQVSMLHLEYKASLVSLSNRFLRESATLPKNKWTPFLIPATQATSIAV